MTQVKAYSFRASNSKLKFETRRVEKKDADAMKASRRSQHVIFFLITPQSTCVIFEKKNFKCVPQHMFLCLEEKHSIITVYCSLFPLRGTQYRGKSDFKQREHIGKQKVSIINMYTTYSFHQY